MQVYTVSSGNVTNTAKVTMMTLSSGIQIPVIQVGEPGRGRKLAFLPVQLLPDSQKVWEHDGSVDISHATIGKTLKGAPKIIESGAGSGNTEALIIVPTMIGYRGGNSHTGDRIDGYDPENIQFQPSPFTILCEGYIAQGDAGNMGSGSQYIATVPTNWVFRTGYSGRLYGAPKSHYYIFTGSQILVATWDERLASDLF
jgi:hypothetical protein